jgi:hypothetical protein
MSLEHVPAPQLASPAGDAFGAPAFLGGAFAGDLVAVDGVALALVEAELVSAAAAGVVDAPVVDSADGVVDAEGWGAATGAPGSGLDDAAIPEQELAEHDA